MNQLQTDNLIALSLLLDEEIYVFNDSPKNNVTPISGENRNEMLAVPEKPTAAPSIAVPKVEPEIIPQPTKNDGFDYLGENNKYILIVVNNADEKFLSKADLAFLVKIMGAKKWTLEDVAIVNMAKYTDLNFEDLKAFFACNKIVTFGFNPAVLNIVGAVANQKSVYKNVAILGTWDLAKLQNDVAKKTVFWNQLKEF
ncbi:MAG TPA: hypothetical protein VL125_11005 [Pelobium sp.]|nr:hypothetical protein [Pelobium sp.]